MHSQQLLKAVDEVGAVGMVEGVEAVVAVQTSIAANELLASYALI